MLRLYFYVHKKSVKDIQKYGYLSMQAQVDVFKTLPVEVLAAYKPLLDQSDESWPGFKEATENMNETEKTLFFINHNTVNDPKRPKPSDAVYYGGFSKSDPKASSALQFLYKPIPNEPDILDYVRNKCHFDLDDYLLFSFHAGRFDEKKYKMVGTKIYFDTDGLSQMEDPKFVIKAWRKAMKLSREEGDSCFKNIPHLYYYAPHF